MAANVLIPTTESALNGRIGTVIESCKKNGKAWGIAANAVSKLDGLYKEFKKQFELCQNPDTRTTTAVKSKNRAKTDLVAEFRAFYQKELKFKTDVVGVAEWERLGLPVSASKAKRKTAVPTGTAVLKITPTGRHSLEIRYTERSSGKLRTKGDKFLMLRHAILDAAPENESVLGTVRLETERVIKRDFDMQHAGRMAWFSACYVNAHGQMGPWSTPVGAVIG
jgi:hypothetical protein